MTVPAIPVIPHLVIRTERIHRPTELLGSSAVVSVRHADDFPIPFLEQRGSSENGLVIRMRDDHQLIGQNGATSLQQTM
nr:hypothetical protein [Cohnella candidum]